MMKLTLILLACCCFSAYGNNPKKEEAAVDILLTDPYLSLKYQRGVYLIYDCNDKHWVCTGKAEFNNCLDSRKIAKTELHEKFACSAVKSFVSEKRCNTVQARLTERAYNVRSCKSENLKSVDKAFR